MSNIILWTQRKRPPLASARFLRCVNKKLLRHSSGEFLVCGLIICLLAGLARPASAATLPISSIAAGKVISINGRQFVKIGTDLVKGSQFMALQADCLPNATPYFTGVMQSFSASDCASVPTPAATCYTYVGDLVDERDGKTYEVRKFADGKCWMADNLMYGGTTDNCASKTTFSGNGSVTASNTFGAGTYGDCRNNPSDASYGYLYNWQAAMQHSSAYYNTTYAGPTSNVQGICPPGWHLPSGGSDILTSEFSQLDIANGGTGDYQTYCTTSSCYFWVPGYNYKGVFSGFSISSGSLSGQGSGWVYGLWSSSENSVTSAWNLYVLHSLVSVGSNYRNKSYGFPVRCIKD